MLRLIMNHGQHTVGEREIEHHETDEMVIVCTYFAKEGAIPYPYIVE